VKTFTAIKKGALGVEKIRARSFAAAIRIAKHRGFDRVTQGGYGLDSGWL
jgi:hypothetical protein